MKFFLHNSISRSMKAAMLFTGLMLATSGLFAQGSGADLGKLNELAFKPGIELTSTIAAEKARMVAELAQPNRANSDIALFTAYKRMLDYIQVDVNANVAVSDAVLKSYEKVEAEAKTDGKLVDMPEGVLITFALSLVEKLQAVPTPVLNPKF